MTKVDEQLEAVSDAEAQVFAWRYERLLRAGVPDRYADKIAGSDFDLHQAEKLLEQGCPPRLLARIAQ
jgi:hypothetical protein